MKNFPNVFFVKNFTKPSELKKKLLMNHSVALRDNKKGYLKQQKKDRESSIELFLLHGSERHPHERIYSRIRSSEKAPRRAGPSRIQVNQDKRINSRFQVT